MKKLLVLFAALLVLLLCACGGEEGESALAAPVFTEADFTEGSHKRGEEYMASFKFRSVEWEGLRLCIAENIFEAEGSSEMAGNIVGSYLALKSLEPSLAAGGELYVVSISPTGGPVLLDGKLYVNVSMIENGDYMPYMAALVYGAGNRWQQEGLTLMARGVQADEYAIKAELIEFLSKNPDTCIMSLHPCYFVEDFAAEDTRHMASMLAYGLTEYIAGETGLAGFLSGGDNLIWRQNWLESIGVEHDLSFLDSPAARRIAAMDFFETEDVPLILEGADFRLNMLPVDWMPDAEEVYSFLMGLCDGEAKLYARFAEEAPVFYASLCEDGGITAVQFRDSGYPISSRAAMLKAEAVVTDDADVLHEICHTLMPRAAIDEAYWLCEGLVTYLTAPYVSYRADSIVVDSVLTEHEGDTDEDKAFRAEVVRCFEVLNGCEVSEVYGMEQPIYRIYEASGYAAFLNPDNNSMPAATQSIKDNYSERHGNSIKGNYPGNELSYLKSMLFVEWLVDKYGLETVIAAEMYKENYFEIFPSADAFAAEFEEFWTVRVEPLEE